MKNLAVYDLETSPCTFDCIKFYLIAVGHFQNQNFAVVIIPPSKQRLDKLLEVYNNQANGILTAEFIWQRMQNILVETSYLVPQISNVQVFNVRNDAIEYLVNNQEHFRQFPKLAPQQVVPASYSLEKLYHQISNIGQLASLVARDIDKKTMLAELKQKGWDGKQSLVSITLRRCQYQENRNSNTKAWLKFAEFLTHNNCFVVWVDDVEADDSFVTVQGYISALATEKIYMRQALYELSALNYFVNSGNAALARFSQHTNSISFKLIVDDYGSTSIKFWYKHNIVPPEQFLHLSPMHYQEWRDDNYQNLLDNFHQHAERMLYLSGAEIQQKVQLWKDELVRNRRQSPLSIADTIDTHKPVYIWGTESEYSYWINYCHNNNLTLLGIIDSFNFDRTRDEDNINVYHPKQCINLQDCNLLVVGFSGNGSKVIQHIEPFIESYYPSVRSLIDGELVKLKECELQWNL